MSVMDFLFKLRRAAPQIIHDSRPSEQDLALQTLHRKYCEYLQCQETMHR